MIKACVSVLHLGVIPGGRTGEGTKKGREGKPVQKCICMASLALSLGPRHHIRNMPLNLLSGVRKGKQFTHGFLSLLGTGTSSKGYEPHSISELSIFGARDNSMGAPCCVSNMPKAASERCTHRFEGRYCQGQVPLGNLSVRVD